MAAGSLCWPRRCHEAGRLAEAERICQQILGSDPINAGAWHLLGLIAFQAGNSDVAAQCKLKCTGYFHAYVGDGRHPLIVFDYTSGHGRDTTDGALAIDNGAAERALRGLTIGRKNWLFCGSERGTQAAAVHFSLIASCHRHGLDAFAYLRDILTRLPQLGPAHSRDELLPLLPDRWTKQ
jgi:hypothetical protein